MANYLIQFHILAVNSGWNDAALPVVFLKGLGEELKDELAAHDETPSFAALIALTTRLDYHLRERWREGRSRVSSSSQLANCYDGSSQNFIFHPCLLPSRNPCSQAEADSPTLRGIGGCLNCGQPGNFNTVYPVRPRRLGLRTHAGVLER